MVKNHVEKQYVLLTDLAVQLEDHDYMQAFKDFEGNFSKTLEQVKPKLDACLKFPQTEKIIDAQNRLYKKWEEIFSFIKNLIANNQQSLLKKGSP